MPYLQSYYTPVNIKIPASNSLDDARSSLKNLTDILKIKNRLGLHKCPFCQNPNKTLHIFEVDGIFEKQYNWKAYCGCGMGSIVEACVKVTGAPTSEIIDRLIGNTAKFKLLKPLFKGEKHAKS
jgi:hypothetical protein